MKKENKNKCNNILNPPNKSAENATNAYIKTRQIVIKMKIKNNIITGIKIFCFVLIMVYFFRIKIVYQPILNLFPTKIANGKIINEKNTMRRGHLTGAFTYSYSFKIKDKEYKNDSYDRKYKIGDTVTIEYNQYLPFINRIKGAEW